MTVPVVKSFSKSGIGAKNAKKLSDMEHSGSRARLFLLLACLWPLLLLASWTVLAPHFHSTAATDQQSTEAVLRNFKFNLRSVLDRVDILGYGPTHPRVAVVLVGEDTDSLVHSLKSVFAYTDMNRLFVICVVVDGKEQDDELVKQLEAIDSGDSPHWHGLEPDQHNAKAEVDTGDKQNPPHGRKVHVLFNKDKMGLTASRVDAIDFIQLLQQRHEKAGLKSPEEDLILLLLDAGAALTGRKWLQYVTDALIVPPPLLQGTLDDKTVAMKIANAVSFNVEGPGKRTAFDVEFRRVLSEPTAVELNLNSGTSYPTPALAGSATAMRLETFVNLPSHSDVTLTDDWSANLDLSLSLWLCADGIDMLADVEVIGNMNDGRRTPSAPLPPERAARFAAAWMDDVTGKKYFNAYSKTNPDLTYLEWQTLLATARGTPSFPKDLHKKCRPFTWLVQEMLMEQWDLFLQQQEELQLKQEHQLELQQQQQEQQKAKKPIVPIDYQIKGKTDDAVDEAADAKKEEMKVEINNNNNQQQQAAGDENAQGGEENADAAGDENADAGDENADGGEEENADAGEENADGGQENADAGDANADGGEENADGGDGGDANAADGGGDANAADGGADANANVATERRAEEQQQQQVEHEQPPPPVEHEEHEQPPPAAAAEHEEHEQPPPAADNNGGEEVNIPQRHDLRTPLTPLCRECLEIVQKAKPVDITFVDVSNGHKEHPHMGARDADGNFGYVFDETALRRNPPPFSFQGNDLLNACSKHDNNYRMLKEKVFVDLESHNAKEKAGFKRDKIFCLVYTIESGHPNIPRIHETWGPKCDGFIVASNKTDPNFGTVDIVHEGPEEYNNIWQKVRSMWSYIYDYYYEKYDWFHIGGDDLYLIVENLRLYLESEEIKTASNGGIYLPDGTEKVQTPLFLGRRFAYQGDMNDIFISGGSGYTMNKAALKLLVTEGFPNYFPNAHTFSEDTMVARVFRNFGVYPYETKDATGAERYMPFMPGHHYGYRLPADKESDWYARYSINIKEGVDHCADRSVAFHYVKGDAMYRLHALLYHLCPAETQ